MDWKMMLSTFGLVFLAELGDKTQLATFCCAAEGKSRWEVFLGSATALVLTSALAVLVGSVADKFIPAQYLKVGAGVLFIVMGLWMVFFSGTE